MQTPQSRSHADAAFTTLPWDGGRSVRAPRLHIARLRDHAHSLGIPWPKDLFDQLSDALNAMSVDDSQAQHENDHCQPSHLLRLEISREGSISLVGRPTRQTAPVVRAVSRSAPSWPAGVAGLKHGDWTPYVEAGESARQEGMDVALLVRDGTVIDGDRATPVLLDHDGTVWLPSRSCGGVPSTTVDLVRGRITASGMPINEGRLTETMFARAREVIMLGSGLAVVQVIEIDGQKIGLQEDGAIPASILQPICMSAIQQEGWSTFEQLLEVVR